MGGILKPLFDSWAFSFSRCYAGRGPVAVVSTPTEWLR